MHYKKEILYKERKIHIKLGFEIEVSNIEKLVKKNKMSEYR